MGKYFGTDGFRGKAGEDLRSEHAFKIGRYLGWYYGQKHPDGERARIVIGKDTRRSSYTFENALAAGITASGADAYLLHVTTTPSVSFITNGSDAAPADVVAFLKGTKEEILSEDDLSKVAGGCMSSYTCQETCGLQTYDGSVR